MKKLLIGITTLIFGVTSTLAYECPADNPYHRLINQTNVVVMDYVAGTLSVPSVKQSSYGEIQKNHMESVAGKSLERMFSDAKSQGIVLTMLSGYRDYQRQSTLYSSAVRNHGSSQRGSAKPGASEHQSGLAVDLNSLSQSFGKTREGVWLASNAHRYGYVIRYPEGKESVTGYMYEPWHIRYVGEELAKKLYLSGKVMEELDTCCDLSVRVYGENSITPYDVNFIKRDNTLFVKLKDLTKLIDMEIEYINGQITCESRGNTVRVDTTHVPIREFLSRLGYVVEYCGDEMRIF